VIRKYGNDCSIIYIVVISTEILFLFKVQLKLLIGYPIQVFFHVIEDHYLNSSVLLLKNSFVVTEDGLLTVIEHKWRNINYYYKIFSLSVTLMSLLLSASI